MEKSEINCYERVFRDGEEHPINQDVYEPHGDDYYKGFIEGCTSIEDNTLEVCASTTDALDDRMNHGYIYNYHLP